MRNIGKMIDSGETMNTNKLRSVCAIILLTTLAWAIPASSSSALNQCVTVGHTTSHPYFEVLDEQGCAKVGYQARWNDYYGNLTYSAIYTKAPAVSMTVYHTASISGTYSNLKGRGCSVTNGGSVCTLGAWYSSVPWTNFP